MFTISTVMRFAPEMPPLPEYLTLGDLATVSLAQSIDVFLFALVMMIFAYGILYLFLIEDEESKRLCFPAWLRIKTSFR